ncbi:glycoside hydrolase family 68 protein [Microbacterium oleivorans]|uniref:glycoside hydrolase family 68 protein n=1 Tax=Microbacterium oleivorans TaxID=273677 RepID=UPI00080E8D05|nr:glycoside hydrolase family 68 protein [Microbacterium oleivorans]
MAFALDTHWVWDFWVADDGEIFHLYYLRAPTSLGDPELRHRHARIGHATSTDLTDWTDHGEVLGPGAPGAFDATATWTGCVVQGDDGLWRMFYTGSVFLEEGSTRNIESIGMATSTDLHRWDKREAFVLRAAGEYYEKLGDTAWPEEAWRDPWVFRDPAGDGWHMLITARGAGGTTSTGGVVGHAWSPDLDTWTVQPPLSGPAQTFAHLEVFQVTEVDGTPVLLFCAPRTTDGAEGVWAVRTDAVPRGAPVDEASLLLAAPHYAGRVVRDRAGEPVVLAFLGSPGTGAEPMGITDPLPARALLEAAAVI